MIKPSVVLLNIFLVSMLVFSQQDPTRFPGLTGPYLGQKPPGNNPEIFAPGVVSTGLNELNSVFSPDGESFYFCVRSMGSSTVFVMKCVNGAWDRPQTLSLAGLYNDIDASLSPDGTMLFFASNRPLSGIGDPKKDYDIWMSERTGDTWGKPVHLGDEVNSERDEFYPVVSKSGTLFFNSQRAGEGTNDIYCSKRVDGRFQQAEKLGPEINTKFREYDAFVAPDESFLVFVSERDDFSGLFVSFRRRDGNWTAARQIGPLVNGAGTEFSPYLSPDAKYLFFTKATRVVGRNAGRPMRYADYIELQKSPENGSTDIWWVSARFIDGLRPMEQ